jgi:hypothetical protein
LAAFALVTDDSTCSDAPPSAPVHIQTIDLGAAAMQTPLSPPSNVSASSVASPVPRKRSKTRRESRSVADGFIQVSARNGPGGVNVLRPDMMKGFGGKMAEAPGTTSKLAFGKGANKEDLGLKSTGKPELRDA